MEKRKIIKNNSKASIVPVLCESNTSVKDIFREIPFRFDVGSSLALMYSAGKRYEKKYRRGHKEGNVYSKLHNCHQ